MHLKNAHIRAAYIETVKRTLVVQQSIEPTHVAGFNQFYDDRQGSRVKQYGIGLDVNFAENLFSGIEIIRRDLDIPQFDINSINFSSRRDDNYRIFIDWLINKSWTFNARLQHQEIINTDTGPLELETTHIPLTLRYQHLSGYFSELITTHVKQNVKLAAGSSFSITNESFSLVDLSLGYRLPKRLGKISLDIKNLFDENFIYQDLNFTRSEHVNPLYIPERMVMGRVTLSF